MSTRTIIEINHDYLRRLTQDPQALAEFLSSFGSHSEKTLNERAPNGIRVLAQRHHTTVLDLRVE